MPAVQTQFNAFHAAIKLDEDDEKETLQTKRDTLLRALKANLPSTAPKFTSFHQGSYSMHTGVVPLNGNFDIDIGIIFECERKAYPDPVVLKKIVRDALDTHGRTVNIRRPCVTVNYMTGDVTNYHVDLAIYAQRADGLLDLAKGKEHSATEHRVWETSDPEQLTKLICGRFSDDAERAQYRRCIRYMKRWRDYQFLKGGPLSIAITVAAYKWFQPKKADLSRPRSAPGVRRGDARGGDLSVYRRGPAQAPQRCAAGHPVRRLDRQDVQNANGDLPDRAAELARRPRQGFQRPCAGRRLQGACRPIR